jgi:general secretion pathway protein D
LLRRTPYITALTLTTLLLAGCPKGNQDYNAGRKAEDVQDYDTALAAYQRALRAEPNNAEYKARETHLRFEDSQYHLEQGEKAMKAGDLQLAMAEFQRAQSIDPSNSAADQEVKRVTDLIAARTAAAAPPKSPEPNNDSLLLGPPELKPLSREPINLKMTNDARVVFETIAKLAGLSVIFDPDFTSRRITAELPDVTLEQALDAVALESKAFWKPLSPNVIFVAPDNPQKRRDVEDEDVQTFYLANTLTPQDITEIITGLRQLLDLRRLAQVNSQNAIVIRDTPDKLALAAKIIDDIDKAKPEVLIHVQVLTASMDRLRNLGILPGQSVTATFNPPCSVQPSSSGCTSSSSSSSSSTSTSPAQITLNALQHLSTADYSITLPGATATAILTDNRTKIIQDPEVRVSDGEKATLKVGERVPVATGSFQAGVGVGTTSSTGVVNPLVNTQFQYIDVGVNVDVTPRVHPDGDVSMKLSIEVSQITGTSSIGGINEPVISQRKIEHDIRLKDGEANVLGGLIERTDTRNVNGIPGVGEVPLFGYLFSDKSKEIEEDEVLIILTPHILRFPSITAANLRSIAAGTDTNARVFREDGLPVSGPATANSSSQPAAPSSVPASSLAMSSSPAGQLRFDPGTVSLHRGESTTMGLAISNVHDLYSIPLMIQYDPKVVQVEDVRNGGFLSGGTQDIAIVQRIDAEKGQVIVSATRQPNSPGVNGTGTIIGLVVRGVAPGSSPLQILQVNARDSQQHAIPLVSGEATINVQ